MSKKDCIFDDTKIKFIRVLSEEGTTGSNAKVYLVEEINKKKIDLL